MTLAIDEKECRGCGKVKSFDDFYKRSGIDEPQHEGHYISECKACMKQRTQNQIRLPKTVPRAANEILAIDYLKAHGIHALPGKAVSAAHVDIAAFGCVLIEVKYAMEKYSHKRLLFQWNLTPRQVADGFSSHIVMLIAEHQTGKRTFHFFRPDNPVFYYHDGRRKTGFTFFNGRTDALKHSESRVVMTQQMMDAAHDDLSMIWDTLKEISDNLRDSPPEA